jgi:hypothetical protein
VKAKNTAFAEGANRFGYRLFGDDGLSHEDVVCAETARVFAAELHGSNAFTSLMNAIATAKPEDYRSLIGRTFDK